MLSLGIKLRVAPLKNLPKYLPTIIHFWATSFARLHFVAAPAKFHEVGFSLYLQGVLRVIGGFRLEPVVGIEPTTDGLRNRCSTTELHWREGLEKPVKLNVFKLFNNAANF